ncbi:hypothetical protein GCM10011531_26930 [Aquaticitalea lipolytica]|uniref:Uncharacterized protein n=1 Tax=Aquaticitalea lipolytica TaxID=1247562 RepID=A0A8J2TSK9_9FLAO|nr:hypothetical protein GCM10011531_26930 [Aquaticitalea lipolytica]
MLKLRLNKHLYLLILIFYFSCKTNGQLKDKNEFYYKKTLKKSIDVDVIINKRFCTKTPKTVTGKGYDKCVEVKKDNGLSVVESFYTYYGVNSRDKKIDSLITKSPFNLTGSIFKTKKWSYSVSYCNNVLVIPAVVPLGNNIWCFKSNEYFLIYHFYNNPFKIKKGKVKIIKSNKDLFSYSEYEIEYHTEKSLINEIKISFIDSRNLKYKMNFAEINFNKEFLSCKVGQLNKFGFKSDLYYNELNK